MLLFFELFRQVFVKLCSKFLEKKVTMRLLIGVKAVNNDFRFPKNLIPSASTVAMGFK